MALDADES